VYDPSVYGAPGGKFPAQQAGGRAGKPPGSKVAALISLDD